MRFDEDEAALSAIDEGVDARSLVESLDEGLDEDSAARELAPLLRAAVRRFLDEALKRSGIDVDDDYLMLAAMLYDVNWDEAAYVQLEKYGYVTAEMRPEMEDDDGD